MDGSKIASHRGIIVEPLRVHTRRPLTLALAVVGEMPMALTPMSPGMPKWEATQTSAPVDTMRSKNWDWAHHTGSMRGVATGTGTSTGPHCVKINGGVVAEVVILEERVAAYLKTRLEMRRNIAIFVM